MGITPDIEVKLPTIKEAKEGNGDSMHVVVREKDLDRHLKNETVKEEKKKDKEKEKGTPSGDDEFVMEVTPKDKKEDIQIQKAIEILKRSVKAEDVFRDLPVSAKTEKTEKEK